MQDVDIDIRLESPLWAGALADCEDLAARAIGAAMKAERADGAVALLLADDEALRDLNARWRGKDKATNVLSFPSPEGFGLGDIALAFETVSAEARAQGKTLAAHMAHLIVHGFLHLLGYDHEDEDEAAEMEARERAILATLGVDDPYAIGPDTVAAE
jgi:probable rRNA maturation factor